MDNVTLDVSQNSLVETDIKNKESQAVARKTFVIDTNVLLHDPYAIEKFPKSNVVIPILVLEELGSMKRLSDERGKNARKVLRLLDSMKAKASGDFQEGIYYENGSKIHVDLDSRVEPTKGLSVNDTHNRIILLAYKLSKKEDRVVFVSKDLVARLKAEALGLEAEDYENLKFSYNSVTKGIRRLEVEKMVIDSFYKDGGVALEGDYYDNEFMILTSLEQSSALGRWNAQKQQLLPIYKAPESLWGIKALNVEQKCCLDLLLREDINLVTIMGQAGTGKTLLALACAMRKVFDESVYSKILVSRPIIPLGKDIGYLPGSKEEKLYHWMQPIYDNLEFLCSSSSMDESVETMRWVMNSKKIEMEAVTYIRGRTLPKIFMIVDEAQNLSPHEVKTIISRAGSGTKVVLTGDPSQIDNPYLDKDSNGLTYAIGSFKGKKLFGHVCLTKTERSELSAMAAEVM